MIRVVGFDPSTSSFGVALPDGTTRTIKPRPGGAQDPARRLNEIIGRLDAYLAVDPPDLVVVEGYDLGPVRGRLAAVRLGELGGVVRVRLFERSIPYIEIPPKQLKLYATGNGNANKDLMFESAVASGATPANTDEADAWWLHALGRHHHGPSAWEPGYRAVDLRDVRTDVRSRIKWPTIERRAGHAMHVL